MNRRAGLWARLRVRIVYRWRHGRWPNLRTPRLFTEHVQWRKLNDRCTQLAALTDKLRGKSHAQGILGPEAIIPTVWSGTALPLVPPASLPLILKANHGCNQSIIIRTQDDWMRARSRAPRWLRHDYGGWLDEWHYRSARRLLLIEPLLGPPDRRLLDYKVYVFGDRAELVQVHIDRGCPEHRWIQFDRCWRRLSATDHRPAPAPPTNLRKMLDAAERLAAGSDFLRVDFYEFDGAILFGEFCLFPGSGLDPFDPPSLDRRLGRLWPRSAKTTKEESS